MIENRLSGKIVDIAYHIHVGLGPGLFESVYEEILYYELTKSGLWVECQHPIPVIWEDIKMDQGFRADLIVEKKGIIEIRSVERVAPVHKKQVLTYLKLSGIKLGLFINFNEALIKEGITRIVNKL